MDKAEKASLEAASLSELRAELHARTGKRARHAPATEAASKLSNTRTESIVKAIVAHEKVIYGTDDRKDFWEFPDAKTKEIARSVAALFRASSITSNGDGTSRLSTITLAQAQGVCSTEKFANQAVGAFCTGFLIAPDVIATAGHCVNAGNVTTLRAVFGFAMTNAATTVFDRISDADIYSGTQVLGHVLDNAGPDWALVRLDRPATGRPALALRKSGLIADGAAVSVMGHPSGLPLKYGPGATVRDNSPTAFFVANLDTYGGNSGSPVFGENFVVEGILVRGETDYVPNGTCNVSKVCPTTGCRGEDCTRITEVDTTGIV